MARGDPQIKVRVPQDLKEYMDKQARENERTLNAEVVFRLTRTRKLDEAAEEDHKK